MIRRQGPRVGRGVGGGEGGGADWEGAAGRERWGQWQQVRGDGEGNREGEMEGGKGEGRERGGGKNIECLHGIRLQLFLTPELTPASY